jgi:hypothetical protein
MLEFIKQFRAEDLKLFIGQMEKHSRSQAVQEVDLPDTYL